MALYGSQNVILPLLVAIWRAPIDIRLGCLVAVNCPESICQSTADSNWSAFKRHLFQCSCRAEVSLGGVLSCAWPLTSPRFLRLWMKVPWQALQSARIQNWESSSASASSPFKQEKDCMYGKKYLWVTANSPKKKCSKDSHQHGPVSTQMPKRANT